MFYVPRDSPYTTYLHTRFSGKWVELKPGEKEEKTESRVAVNKTRPVLMKVSHCNTPNYRLEYAQVSSLVLLVVALIYFVY